jgi:hypothetical protein
MEWKEGRCMYTLPNGEVCNKYICDEHAEEVELIPYGRFCEYCGIDTFNELKHKDECPVKDFEEYEHE